MTGNQDLAKLPQQCSPLAHSAMIARCEPATAKQGSAELGACLTLVSPSGMTAEDRREWLAIAMRTLSGIPADLLAEGCAYARLHCKFPSEIVPMIMSRVGKRWEWRKQDAERMRPRSLPAPEPKPEYVQVSEVRGLIKQLTAKARAA